MNKTMLVGTALACFGFAVIAADSGPKEELTKAIQTLAEKPGYSWRTTVAVPEDSPFKPGPTDGKIEKNGLTELSMKFGENTTQAFIKGEKAAASNPDGGWQSLADLDNSEGPRRFLGMMLRNFKAPAEQAKELVSQAKELKKDGDIYLGDLTEEGAKALLTFRRRSGGEGPTVTNPKGSVKFWLKDGALTKYEFKVKGTVSFNGNDFENDRTTTVEIKDVGSTKVDMPDEAGKKLS